MKTNVIVTSGLLLSAMVLVAGSLWAQPAPGDVPPPPPGGPNGPPEAMGPDPVCLDGDGNGRVTAPEFSNGLGPVMKDRFKRLDTNGDGSLSLEEFEKAPGPPRGPRGRTQGPGNRPGPPRPPLGGEAKGQYPPEGMPEGMPGGQRPTHRPPFPAPGECDVNNDGVITEAEFLTAHQQAALERFKELDIDQDGQVTLEQLRPPRGPMGGPRDGFRPGGGPDGGPGPRGPRR